MEGNQKLSHIIDPKTVCYSNDYVLSTKVIVRTEITAVAYATAFIVMDYKNRFRF